LTRQKKKAETIKLLCREIEEENRNLHQLQEKMTATEDSIKKLESEYKNIPDFQELSQALENQKTCNAELDRTTEEYIKTERQKAECAGKKNDQYQKMLQSCKQLPYGRTEKEYDDVLSALEEYQQIWQTCKELLLHLKAQRDIYNHNKEFLEQNEQLLDDCFANKRSCNNKIKEYDIQISQYEEYLNNPEVKEKSQRLQQLNNMLDEIKDKKEILSEEHIRKTQTVEILLESEPRKKNQLQELIAEENVLRNIFDEELSLKLIMQRENRTLAECGKEAVRLLRAGDKDREPSDILQALNSVYQKHNGSLTNYGTSLEECFGSIEEGIVVKNASQYLRKRMRVVSVWKGKKVFLEEFYQILKAAIDETELLIQQKDRELFEDILSQTISQQLTDRIAESRSWVKDMSNLMKELDTSMGLSFLLEWKPRSAENNAELDTMELEQILLRDRNLLTMEDIEKVAVHFRSKIRMEKAKQEEAGGLINYMELVRDALDYRKWFEFRMFYKRGDENKKQLTNAAFNRFSGGEKAMAMYVPLFAAVNAQYKKASNEEHPRMIALDEAFAGVDDKNISSMFELANKMDFDYIMNSQSLWGCYETVKGLKIAELHKPQNSQIVTVIRYTWNGRERRLDEQ
jgi:hypothetical protein